MQQLYFSTLCIRLFLKETEMRQYIVDAFTEEVFKGNPAAVCVMDAWLSDEMMLKIAKENNLSETAFTVAEDDMYHLRWFTPGGEIDLCGHATLATAYVIARFIHPAVKVIRFRTLSGVLEVTREGELFEMDFPAFTLRQVPVTPEMAAAVRLKPAEAYLGRDLLLVVDDEEDVRSLDPDLQKIAELEGQLLHVTSRGKDFDCVSRSFAPKLHIPEDPVCGSGHCYIVPYWAEKLGKHDIHAFQASERSGILFCSHQGERVKLRGKAALFSIAELYC